MGDEGGIFHSTDCALAPGIQGEGRIVDTQGHMIDLIETTVYFARKKFLTQMELVAE